MKNLLIVLVALVSIPGFAQDFNGQCVKSIRLSNAYVRVYSKVLQEQLEMKSETLSDSRICFHIGQLQGKHSRLFDMLSDCESPIRLQSNDSMSELESTCDGEKVDRKLLLAKLGQFKESFDLTYLKVMDLYSPDALDDQKKECESQIDSSQRDIKENSSDYEKIKSMLNKASIQ